jgi:NodT family efflux transporter outer membrane factor (OMF) lipoprotein
MYKRIIFSAFLASLCAGCRTLGPNYAGAPEVALPDTFARAAESADKPRVAKWWSQLGDPVLDSLIDRALKTNPNLAAAQTRVRQARAALRSERANSQPKSGTTLMYAHARLPSIGDGSGNSPQLPSSLELYNLGFDATWEIDLFGGRRRAVEASEASAQSVEASVADVQVSLVAEVAQVYVNFRSGQQRLALGDAAVSRQQRILELTQRRRQAGTASELDLVRLQGQLESTVAQTQSLRAELDVYRDALAALLGQAPGALDTELAQAAPVPMPPATVTVGDPAALLRNRPDIRAAERTLAARTAQIGQAESARFPHLTLMGLIGIGGTRASDLTHLDDFIGLAAPQLSWNFLDFGRSAANIEKANGARDEAEAQYRATVLAALRDAEDALSRFRQRRVTVATRARTQALAARAAHLTLERQRAGTATLIDQLDAERTQISAEQDLAVAKAALTGDFIALHKSLGLGWIKADR